MCKSSSLCFVLLFALLLKIEKFRWPILSVIVFIFVGVFLMVFSEVEFNLLGYVPSFNLL